MPERDALSSKSKLSSQAFSLRMTVSLPPSYDFVPLKFDITAFLLELVGDSLDQLF